MKNFQNFSHLVHYFLKTGIYVQNLIWGQWSMYLKRIAHYITAFHVILFFCGEYITQSNTTTPTMVAIIVTNETHAVWYCWPTGTWNCSGLPLSYEREKWRVVLVFAFKWLRKFIIPSSRSQSFHLIINGIYWPDISRILPPELLYPVSKEVCMCQHVSLGFCSDVNYCSNLTIFNNKELNSDKISA